MQHFRVKLFARPGHHPDPGAAIPIFHRWIQENALGEMLIDVADYRHVPEGPGVVLVGHDAFYSLDSAGGRLGLLYNRRTEMNGTTGDKLRSALSAAAKACLKLEQEPELEGKLRFGGDECEISVNDRLLAPNNDATWEGLKPDLARVLDSLWGAGAYELRRTGEARELLTAIAKASDEQALGKLVRA